MCLCACMLALEWKGRSFLEKVNSRCFCWFAAAILVDSFRPPIWVPYTKRYKGASNVSANNSETVGHKDLRFGQIVYILVFYNISFPWLLPLDGFQVSIFFCAVFITWQWKRRTANAALTWTAHGEQTRTENNCSPVSKRKPPDNGPCFLWLLWNLK